MAIASPSGRSPSHRLDLCPSGMCSTPPHIWATACTLLQRETSSSIYHTAKSFRICTRLRRSVRPSISRLYDGTLVVWQGHIHSCNDIASQSATGVFISRPRSTCEDSCRYKYTDRSNLLTLADAWHLLSQRAQCSNVIGASEWMAAVSSRDEGSVRRFVGDRLPALGLIAAMPGHPHSSRCLHCKYILRFATVLKGFEKLLLFREPR